MFDIINYPTFLLAGILLNLTPGSDTLYILGRSIAQGKKAGVLSALGISTGSLVHCLKVMNSVFVFSETNTLYPRNNELLSTLSLFHDRRN